MCGSGQQYNQQPCSVCHHLAVGWCFSLETGWKGWRLLVLSAGHPCLLVHLFSVFLCACKQAGSLHPMHVQNRGRCHVACDYRLLGAMQLMRPTGATKVLSAV